MVTREWEVSAQQAEGLARLVIGRFGVVLAKDGGALAKLLIPFRLGAGGPVGSGQQWMSWVDRDDVIRFVEWAVDNDQAQGAALATQHLLDLGHQGVWHIAGPRTSYSAARREQSWADTMREAGITPPPVFRGDWSTTSGYEIGLEIAERPEITAVFASNDQMALGAADAVRAAGAQGEIEVVGFDGISEALAAIARGSMSATVAQYPYTMGQLSIEACLAALSGDPVPASVDAPVQVVTSGSVAQARSNSPKPAEPFDDPFKQ